MRYKKSLQMIEIADLGQVGAGKVVDFIPRGRKIRIVRPANTSEKDELFSHSVCGDSLYDPFDPAKSVMNGDSLICKANFDISIITPSKICIVYIVPTCERVAKKVIREKGKIRLRAANPAYPDRIYSVNDIEIKGIVIGFQRNFF